MAVASVGCSTTVDYTRVALPFKPGTGPISLTVVDSRLDPVEPSWVGIVRSSFALPFGVHTESGSALSKDMASALVHSLSEAGYAPTDPSSSVAGYALELQEWSSDGYFGTLTLSYGLTLRVLRGGRVVGEVQREGELVAAYELRSRYSRTCERLFAEVLWDLFAEAQRLPRALDAGVKSPGSAGAVCAKCDTALEGGWTVCPVCATPREGNKR